LKPLGEQASGMRTDRATILEAEAEVDTGTWDLVITEDLARLYRNPRYQYAFVQNAVDQDTRVICIGDNLDTADDNWEVSLGAARPPARPHGPRRPPPRPPHRYSRLPPGRHGPARPLRLPEADQRGGAVRAARPAGLADCQGGGVYRRHPLDWRAHPARGALR